MKNKLKIVQISSFYPPHIGGAEIFVREISERLAKRRHKIEVFTSNIFFSGIDSLEEKLKSTENLKIHYLKSFEIAHTPIIPSLFFRLLKTQKNSLFHLNAAQAFVSEIVWLVSKIRKTLYIVYVHVDLEPSGKLGFLLPLYKKIFFGNVLRNAKKVIVGTADYAEIIHKKYAIPKNRIIIIPCGISLDAFNCKNIESREAKNILFVGRLSKQKNVHILIKSFKKVFDRGYDLKLHLIGSGEEKENIISLIKSNGLQNRVVLYGGLPWRDLSKIYSNFDIFVLPSRGESFGLVLLEAMASGLPIIASNIPGLRNVVENNKTGLLVEPSVENFAEAIEKMVNNRNLREKLIKNGLKEVKKYDWDKIVEKFENVYREVLNETN